MQANMHQSRTADSVLSQLAFENTSDVMIVSEQYSKKKGGSFIENIIGMAAIWLPTISRFSYWCVVSTKNLNSPALNMNFPALTFYGELPKKFEKMENYLKTLDK